MESLGIKGVVIVKVDKKALTKLALTKKGNLLSAFLNIEFKLKVEKVYT